MALKALNSVGGFSVGETPSNVIYPNGDFTGNKANFTGNIAALGLLTDNLYYANGTAWDLQQAAGLTGYVQFNDGNNFAASANFTFNSGTNVLTVNGNIGATRGSFTNIAGEGGNISNIQGGNVSGAVASATSATTAGTVTTNAQPNITSVGTLTGLNVSGVSNLGAVGNVIITGGSSGFYLQTNGSGNLTWAAVPSGNGIANGTSNVSIPVINGNVNTSVGGNANVFVVTGTGVNVAGTLNATGNANVGNIQATLVYANTALYANTIQSLTNADGGNLYVNSANSANTGDAGGNIVMTAGAGLGNDTSGGNIFVVAGIAGAANGIGGYARVRGGSGNTTGTGGQARLDGGASVGGGASVIAWGGGNTTAGFGGNVTVQGGTASGTDKAGGIVTISGGRGTGAGQTGNVVFQTTDPLASGATAQTLADRLVISGNVVNVVTSVDATSTSSGAFRVVGGMGVGGNVYAGAFYGPATGLTSIPGANVTGTVPSATAATNASALLQNTSTATTVYPTFSTSSANGNSSAVINTGISANLANASITATTFVGALSGAATSATTAGTVTTNAQPNITSVGTLTSLNVSGNANVGNLGTAGLITATGNVSGGNLTTGGALSVTGNANVGNLGTATAIITTGNITTINSGLLQNGNSNITITANGNISLSATGAPNELVITSTGVNVAGTLNATGNANVGNLGTAQVLATANVTTPQLIANIANGTAPLLVNSQTLVANLNADLLDGYNTATAATANTVAVRDASGNITANFFIGNGSQLTGITASQVTGLSSIANGTSNVSIPAVNGNVTVGVAGNANIVVVTGTGANITGTANVSGNANVGNLGTSGQILATGNITTNANIVTDFIAARTGNLTISASVANSSIILDPAGTGVVNVSGARISSLADPTFSSDAATKYYVDNAVSAGLNFHTAVNVETPTALTATYANGGTTPTWTSITTTDTLNTGSAHGLAVNDVIVFGSSTNGITAGTAYFVAEVPSATSIKITTVFSGSPITTLTNGTGLTITSRANSGVGATLTNSGTQVALQIDGVTLSVNDRVLVYNQVDPAQNGIYTVTNVGSGSTNWVLTRATDADTYIPNSNNGMGTGDFFYVQQGLTGAGESYVNNTTGVIVFGTTNITFAQFSDTQIYTAGTGLALTGTQFRIANTAVTAASYGNGDRVATFTVNQQGQLTAAADAVITANAGNLTGTTLNSSIVTSSLTTVGTLGSLSVTGNTTSGNFVGVLANGNSNVTITANGNVTINAVGGARITATSAGANVTGTLGVSSTITGTQLISNIATGTAPLTVTSTTRVDNLNVAYANVSDFINVTAPGTGTGYLVFANATTGNVAEWTSAGISSNLANNSITATTFVGALSGAATSATTAGTVTTNAQPNITSVGTLTSLAVSGNISSGNANLGNLATANFFTGTLVNGTSNAYINGSGGNFLISVGGTANIVEVSASGLGIGNTDIGWGTVTTVATTANQTIAQFNVTGVTGVEFLVKGIDATGAKYSVATVTAVTDGTTADYSIYATAAIGGSTGTLVVNKTGSNLALQVTPSSSNSTVWTAQYRTI